MKWFFLAALFFSQPLFASAENTDKLVDDFIRMEAKRLGGIAYEKGRKIAVSLDRNKEIISVVALYTIENINRGNNYSQFMVAFQKNNESYKPTKPVLVGGKGYRSIDIGEVKGLTITLLTKNYTDEDPICCPSLQGKSWFYITEEGLVEKLLKFEVTKK
ncbi:MAG: hypothetical protein HYZ46_06755 [Nitrosomonadales bacterium]|nr:hypothetical protein [Nitrosomonadales bacterium]